ncbi:MAG: membrane protein insertion efficiency factor YidD [Clostridia bacterium]|nr:membrane protein insertion efficiency factor YidD [Clostridia bacterium]
MKRALLASIRFYQRNVSPLKPGCCRFVPTCSEYAAIAVERYGAAKGSRLAVRRLLRCHPMCRGGYDPVPELPAAVIRRDEN